MISRARRSTSRTTCGPAPGSPMSAESMPRASIRCRMRSFCSMVGVLHRRRLQAVAQRLVVEQNASRVWRRRWRSSRGSAGAWNRTIQQETNRDHAGQEQDVRPTASTARRHRERRCPSPTSGRSRARYRPGAEPAAADRFACCEQAADRRGRSTRRARRRARCRRQCVPAVRARSCPVMEDHRRNVVVLRRALGELTHV